MSDILRTIKDELGPDAVILSTREMGRQGHGAKTLASMEVTVAIDQTPVEQTKEISKNGFDEHLETALQEDLYKEIKTIKSALADIRNTYPAKDALPSKKIVETWHEMKVMLKALTDSKKEDPCFSENRTLFHIFQILTESGIDSATAKDLCIGLKSYLSPEALWETQRVKHSLREMIEDMVMVTGDLASGNRSARTNLPKVIALVGPTGVGKTTTIAKLGAMQIKKSRKVTLVSLEDQKIGEGYQLERYANRLGIPVRKVGSCEKLRMLISQKKGGEIIMIDTPGRSHFDSHGFSILRNMREMNVPVDMQLVLSANIKISDMADMIDRFSTLSISSVVFTKLDETGTYGALFSAVGRKRKPISYLTTGRKVPEDIEVATSRRFANLILNGRQGILGKLNKSSGV